MSSGGERSELFPLLVPDPSFAKPLAATPRSRPQEVDPKKVSHTQKKERIAIDTPLFYSLDPAETGRSLLVHLEAIVAIHQEADCLLGCCHAGVVVGLCCLRAHLLRCEEDA